jgi:hypothetical protein
VQALIFILQITIIFGGTYAIYTIDRNRRRAVGGLSMKDPDTKTLMLLNLLLNLVCLPYYFKNTRGSMSGMFIGIGWFLLLLVTSIGVGVIGTLAAAMG